MGVVQGRSRSKHTVRSGSCESICFYTDLTDPLRQLPVMERRVYGQIVDQQAGDGGALQAARPSQLFARVSVAIDINNVQLGPRNSLRALVWS